MLTRRRKGVPTRRSVKTITDNTALREIADQFQNAPFLAVDTEFMRERTYYPQLCLVQISDGTTAVAIDPLAKGLDLAPLWALMRDERHCESVSCWPAGYGNLPASNGAITSTNL